MKFAKFQQEKYTTTSAIFFSLLIHFVAGIFLFLTLSTNAIFSPESNGIKLVWISFDDKMGISNKSKKNNLPEQTIVPEKRTNAAPEKIETSVHHAARIQTAVVTTTRLTDYETEVNKEVPGRREIQETSYPINAPPKNEITGNNSSLSTVIAYPLYKENSPPVYPEIARVRGYEGIVLVSAEILPNGRVGDVKIRKSSGYAILDRSAIQAVKPWKFEPAKKSGNPFTAWVELPIKFILNSNSQS